MKEVETSVLITAHRGMGVNNKGRHYLIGDAIFYPENSIAAFERAIEFGVDALECDIHVSKDNIALVIHGNTIPDYATYIGPEHDKLYNKDLTCNRFSVKEIKEYFILKNFGEKTSDPKFSQIPTLTELLELAAAENEKRFLEKKPSLKLNIELKGKNSGFITLDTIYDFNRSREKEGRCLINPDDIILLGKVDVGEITVAKNILNYPGVFSITQKDKGAWISNLFGEKEFHAHFSQKDWSLSLIDVSPENKTKLPENISSKTMLLSEDNKISYVKDGKLFGRTIEADLTPDERKQIEQAILKKNPLEINEAIQSLILKTGGIPLLYSGIPQEYKPAKICERIASYEAALSGRNLDENPLRKNEHLPFLNSFLMKIDSIRNIRTNVMLSSGDLYGTHALIKGCEDFEVRPDITTIPNSSYRLIVDCFNNGYNGIDVNLFDFDEKIYQAILEGVEQYKKIYLEKTPIIGVSASNWKGVLSERSPVSPAESLMKAQIISTRSGFDVLMKVDEPGLFKNLNKIINNTITESEQIIFSDTIESEPTIMDFVHYDRISDELLKSLGDRNYDVSMPSRPRSYTPTFEINRTEKPPRGYSKSPTPTLEEINVLFFEEEKNSL